MYYNPYMRLPPQMQQGMVQAPMPAPVAVAQPIPVAQPQPSQELQTLGSAAAHIVSGKPMPVEEAKAQDPSLFQSLGQRAVMLFAPDKTPAGAPAQPAPDDDSLAKRAMKNG